MATPPPSRTLHRPGHPTVIFCFYLCLCFVFCVFYICLCFVLRVLAHVVFIYYFRLLAHQLDIKGLLGVWVSALCLCPLIVLSRVWSFGVILYWSTIWN